MLISELSTQRLQPDSGGAKRDRTADLLRARQALSQLSYGPVSSAPELVGLGRFELPTSPLSGVRSNQLSYRPITGRHQADLTLLSTTAWGALQPTEHRPSLGVTASSSTMNQAIRVGAYE